MRFYKINRIDEFNYEAPIFLMNKEIPQCAPPNRFAHLQFLLSYQTEVEL